MTTGTITLTGINNSSKTIPTIATKILSHVDMQLSSKPIVNDTNKPYSMQQWMLGTINETIETTLIHKYNRYIETNPKILSIEMTLNYDTVHWDDVKL
jgi:hypothetical protein